MSEQSSQADPMDDPRTVVVGHKEGITLFSKSAMDVLMQLPLPGVVIFVHGVNSDGEWYEQAEQGLCKGLNERLRRCDEHLKYKGVEAGQLFPAKYLPELDPDGYLNPNLSHSTFIDGGDNYSPVIRFRWGYKASGEELKEFGANIYLNEQNYWGGGPFANGCSSVPDLWGEGLDDQLFLWIHAQHLNPTADRQVFKCPPRSYYVLAAYRLARLVEAIRKKQADVPISIVCHSQGNMVGLCAAFLGDALPEATDAAGRSSKCVADSYVLCNPPYSLVEKNFTENWSARGATDAYGRSGRQTYDARTRTLAAFFDIVRARQGRDQPAERIDRRMSNPAHGYTAGADRARYGLGGGTCGRVTLYCNPHDQVISATPVKGIGWRGMSAGEIAATSGLGVLTQRVFAQGFEVGGPAKLYDYWADHHRKGLKPGSPAFWHPESQPVRYSVTKGWEANESVVAKAFTFIVAPLMVPALGVANVRINGLPPDEWKVPLLAPALPDPFLPEAVRLGKASTAFDQGHDAAADYRNPQRQRSADDPYASAPGEAQGDEATEAGLRYENHAVLRMYARREGLYKADAKVVMEDEPDKADEKYRKWQRDRLAKLLRETVDTHATDHSTIMTNVMHAQKALAYDVAVGCCEMSSGDLYQLRTAADWRLVKGLGDDDPNKAFAEYFSDGTFRGMSAHDWANAAGSEVAMPEKIANERTNPAPQLSGADA